MMERAKEVSTDQRGVLVGLGLVPGMSCRWRKERCKTGSDRHVRDGERASDVDAAFDVVCSCPQLQCNQLTQNAAVVMVTTTSTSMLNVADSLFSCAAPT